MIALCRGRLFATPAGRAGRTLAALVAAGFAMAAVALRVTDGADASLSGVTAAAAPWIAWIAGAALAYAAAEDRAATDRREGIEALCAARGISPAGLESARALAAMTAIALAIGAPLVFLSLVTAALAGRAPRWRSVAPAPASASSRSRWWPASTLGAPGHGLRVGWGAARGALGPSSPPSLGPLGAGRPRRSRRVVHPGRAGGGARLRARAGRLRVTGVPPATRATPVVELARVHARDAAGPLGRSRGALTGASIALGPGVHAFLGTPEDGTLALADLVTGARAPLRGRVTVAGRDPARTPYLRARIGVLPAEPRLLAARTVRDAVRLALRARGETGDRFDAILDPLGLSHLQARVPRSLAFAEQRAVELALAVSTPAPMLLALHEPLADVAMPRLDLLPLRLREAAAAGACVLLTTSSPADARALADHVVLLHKGVIAREARGGAGLVLGDDVTLRVWIEPRAAGASPGSGARALVAALALRPEVRAVSWRETAGEPSVVEVRGDHAEACALAVIESALATGVEIEALIEEAPALGDVRVATEALWEAMRSRPAPPPAPVAARPSPPAAPSPPAPTPPAPPPGAEP